MTCTLPRYDSLLFSSTLVYFSIGNASNYQYMIRTTGGSDKAPATILERTSTGFEEISQLFCYDCASSDAVPVNSMRFNSDCTRVILTNGGYQFPAMRIYSTTDRRTFKMIQKMTYAAGIITSGSYEIVCLSKDDSLLMVVVRISTLVYQKDATGLYNNNSLPIFNTTGAVGLNSKARAMTPDGLFLIQDLNQINLTVLCIYGYDNVTYTFLSYFDLGTPTANIKKISIADSSSSGLYRVIIYTNVYAQYFEMSTTITPLSATFTLVQTIDTAVSGNLDGYLTMNGQYLMLTNKSLNYREFYLY